MLHIDYLQLDSLDTNNAIRRKMERNSSANCKICLKIVNKFKFVIHTN